MNLRQSHVLVSQPLLKIRAANLTLKNLHFIANISPGIFRVIQISASLRLSVAFTVLFVRNVQVLLARTRRDAQFILQFMYELWKTCHMQGLWFCITLHNSTHLYEIVVQISFF